MQTLAQKKAQENFKKAIAYRTKTGCSLKEAFAHVKGKKVGVVKKRSSSPLKKKATKKAATKKPTLKYRGTLKAQDGKKMYKYSLGSAKDTSHKDTKSHNVNIKVVSGIFDTQIIEDLDSLKKQYFKLAKKYHPDAGGTTIQFQQLQAEYEQLLQKLLKGSSLNTDQKENEIVIDKAIRDIIDAIINIDGLNIEVVGKWLWVGGETYPVRTTLKAAGLEFIKKAGVPYWVYKGSESKGRGKMSIEEIRSKYGSQKMEAPKNRKISGFRLTAAQRSKLKRALIKLTKGLDKRPV